MDQSYFVYKLIPPRPSFAFDMTDAEMRVMAEHGGYWARHVDAGRVVAFGPVLDEAGTWGLAVVAAETTEEVRSLGTADPAVTSGVCTFEVHAMGPSVVRPLAPKT